MVYVLNTKQNKIKIIIATGSSMCQQIYMPIQPNYYKRMIIDGSNNID